MNYYAHYNPNTQQKQLLKEHLQAVKDEIEQRFIPKVAFPGINNDLLKEIACQIGYFHDIGKYTRYFQEYLLNKSQTYYKTHSHISACLLYNFLKSVCKNRDDRELSVLFFLSYLCVRLHHNNLTLANLFDNSDEDIKVLEHQKSNLLKEAYETIVSELFLDNQFGEKIDFDSLCSIQSLLNDKNFKYIPHYLGSRLKSEKWFFLLIYLFSLLIDADKHNSAGMKFNARNAVVSEKVNKYILYKHYQNRDTELVRKREEARKKIIERIKELTADKELLKKNGIFTITAPTGIGKTLASLQAALVLQERIKIEFNYTPLIISAIPFINIIEQTGREYEKIIQKDGRLIINHSLADIATNIEDENEDIVLDKTLLEIESWEGDIILTTFVQLFHSIFSSKNRSLKKINKLAGSIVVLDEIQSIPEKYMPLIGALLIKLNQFYGTYFILMTATQPKLLEFGNQLIQSNIPVHSQELLLGHEKYFSELRRTKLISLMDKGELDTEGFIELFFDIWSSEKSALIVVNTIKRSIEIFNTITDQIRKLKLRIPVLYLSTNIIPRQRAAIVKKAKRYLKWNIPIIMVSTQTIEAGVDLDFDMAFRDIAPIESIIQTAGRVNREGKKGEYLPVYIIHFERDSKIYNLHNLEHVRNILERNPEIPENDYHNFVEEYYGKLLQYGVSDQSYKIWNEGILRLDFDILKEFQLVEKTGEIMDVIVECDQYISNLLSVYEILYKEKLDEEDIQLIMDMTGQTNLEQILSKYDRKNLLRIIFSKIGQYIVQIRAKRLIGNRPLKLTDRYNNPAIHSDLLWIPLQEIERYYDKNTGFIDKSGKAFVF